MADVSTHSTLPTSLVSYFELEETSGTRYDTVGSNDLTDVNTCDSGTGIQGNASHHTRTSQEYLQKNTPSGLPTGSGNRSVSMWAKFDSIPTTGANTRFMFDWGSAASGQEFGMGIYSNDGTNVQGYYDKYGAGGAFGTAYTGLSTGTWYHFVWTYDGTTLKVYIDTTERWSTTPSITGTTGAYLNISSRINNLSPAEQHDGYIDEVGIWSKILSSTEITDLYNGGAGLPYVDTGGTFTPPAHTLGLLGVG